MGGVGFGSNEELQKLYNLIILKRISLKKRFRVFTFSFIFWSLHHDQWWGSVFTPLKVCPTPGTGHCVSLTRPSLTRRLSLKNRKAYH